MAARSARTISSRSSCWPATSEHASSSRSRARRCSGSPRRTRSRGSSIAGTSTAGRTIGLSIGVATFPRPSGDAPALIESADTAMYKAKESGGGVRVWEHSFADGPRGSLRSRTMAPPAPYLAEPARLATPELQTHLSHALAVEWNAVVVGKEGQVLTIALPGPNNAAVNAISKASGFAVYPVYSNPADLEATRKRLSEPGK